MLGSRHEAVFEGSEIEGARRRRRRQTQGEQVAKTFSVSVPTIKRWLKRRRETGDVQPRAIPGRPSRKGAMLEQWLPEQLEKNHDLTLQEHREAFEEEEFGEEAVSTSSTVGRAIARLGPQGGWPLKKSPKKVASEREEEARGFWRWLASRLDARRRLVFVDESGFHTSMTRLYARAPRGHRAYGKVPRNRGKNTTLIAAITLEGAMGESMAIEGATDALAFSRLTWSTCWPPP